MKAAVVCTPGSAQMHFYLAAVHLRLKQIPEATSEFDKTLETGCKSLSSQSEVRPNAASGKGTQRAHSPSSPRP